MKKIIIIIIIFFVLISFISCNIFPNNKSDIKAVENPEDIEKYQRVASAGELDEFKKELEAYISYSDEILPLWAGFVAATKPILYKFNNENNFGQKIFYAKELKSQYQSFFDKVSIIKPPGIAEKAHELALNTIKKRIEYVSTIETNNDYKEITGLKNNVYMSEVMFWMEIDQIYSYFDHRAKELGLNNPEEKLFTLSNNPKS
jgi:hypothetical protein